MGPPPVYDFVIVGSGASGGVLAYTLQKAGAKCLLLEAGKYHTAETFPPNEADYSAQLFWGGGIELNTQADLGFLRGKCVGGSSVINQALQDRLDDIALDDWQADSGVDFFSTPALSPYYDRAESFLALETIPAEKRNRSAQLFIEGMENIGVQWKGVCRGQDYCGVGDDHDCIACLGGCPRNSKQSTLVCYIMPAEQEGLEIRDRFLVDQIEPKDDSVVIRGGNGSGQETLRAKQCILAGGSWGTTQLLLKSGFKTKLPALGTGMTGHPQFMTFAEFEEQVDAHKGVFQSVASSDPDVRKRGFKIENVYAQPVSVAMLYPGCGLPLQEFMANYRHYACLEVCVRDEATGVMTVNRQGTIKFDKRLTDQDYRRRDDGLALVQLAYESLRPKRVVKSQFEFCLHLMGGCPIGSDDRSSVVNEAFRVHGHENLLVADSSIFPNAPGINPGLTVMALAHRLSESLLAN